MHIEHWKTSQLAAFSKLDKASDFSFSLKQDHSQREFQGLFLVEIPSYPNRLCINSPLNKSKTVHISSLASPTEHDYRKYEIRNLYILLPLKTKIIKIMK